MGDVPAEVYARIEALEAQVAELSRRLGPELPPPLPDARHDEVVQVLRSRNKIHAIKRHRELYGTSLRDAKAAVDDLERRGLG